MAKRDWLRECNDQNVPPQEFHQIFCVRCRNPDCSRAGYAGSIWADRMTTQVERLLENPHFADLSIPQYAQVNANDFPDALRQALRIEIARKRGDWELPPEDLTTEQAVRELAGLPAPQEPVTKAASLAVTVQEDPDGSPEGSPETHPQAVDNLPDGNTDATTGVAKAVQKAKKPKQKQTETNQSAQENYPSASYKQNAPQNTPPTLVMTNTPFPVGGLMLDGSRPTSTTTPKVPDAPKPIVVDPWAVPAPVENVVSVGAKIRLGFATADGNERK